MATCLLASIGASAHSFLSCASQTSSALCQGRRHTLRCSLDRELTVFSVSAASLPWNSSYRSYPNKIFVPNESSVTVSSRWESPALSIYSSSSQAAKNSLVCSDRPSMSWWLHLALHLWWSVTVLRDFYLCGAEIESSGAWWSRRGCLFCRC